MKTIIRSALMLAALSLAACGDDSTGPGRFSGTTDFQYSGAFSGSFHANGSGLGSGFETGSFALAQRYEQPADGQGLFILAQQDREGTLVDNLLLSVENLGVGTTTCAAGAACGFSAILVLGDDGRSEDDDAEAILFSTGGTVTVNSVTDSRATGTFQFTLTDVLDNAQSTTRVTSGTFDVPVVDAVGTDLSRVQANRARFSRSR